jgi:hypothetical protein
MNASLDLAYLGTHIKSPILAHRAAGSAFDRAFSRGSRCRLWSKLTGRSSSLLTLDHQPVRKAVCRSKQIISVPLDQIVGSESRCEDFDRNFNPLKINNRERWIGIAIAYRKGAALPPVDLIQVADHFFVRDGHHRISVARSLGQVEIEARIVN